MRGDTPLGVLLALGFAASKQAKASKDNTSVARIPTAARTFFNGTFHDDLSLSLTLTLSTPLSVCVCVCLSSARS